MAFTTTVLIVIGACEHTDDASSSVACDRSKSVNSQGWVIKGMTDNGATAGTLGRDECVGGKPLISIGSRDSNDDKRIQDWQSNTNVAYVSTAKWLDQSGEFRLILFKDLANDCIILESIRISGGKRRIYSKKVCEFIVENSSSRLLLQNNSEILPKSIEWFEEKNCPGHRKCDSTAVRFRLKSNTADSKAHVCTVSRVSDSNLPTLCKIVNP